MLNLSYNMITQLDSDIFTSLKSLTALNLQYNSLKYFHIKSSFKLIKIVLAGNPWTCSCDLLDLQIWLTASNVTMGKFWLEQHFILVYIKQPYFFTDLDNIHY